MTPTTFHKTGNAESHNRKKLKAIRPTAVADPEGRMRRCVPHRQ